MKTLSSLKEVRNNLCLLRNEFAWSIVEENEKKIQSIDSKILEFNVKISELELSSQSLKTDLKNLEDKKQLLEHKISSHIKNTSNQNIELTKLEISMKDLISLIQKRSLENQSIDEQIAVLGKEQEKFDTTMLDTKDDAVNFTEKFNDLSNNKSFLDNQIKNIEKSISDNEYTLNLLNRSKINLSHKITSLENMALSTHGNLIFESNFSINHYGRNLDNVIKDIKMFSWEHKPIGPIGCYVSILNIKWKRVLEEILGLSLGSFIVSCSEDRQTLTKILQKHATNNPITILKSQTIQPFALNFPYPNALSVVKISNPAVLKCLVLSTSLERILLCESRKDAENTLLTKKYDIDAIYTLSGRLSLK